MITQLAPTSTGPPSSVSTAPCSTQLPDPTRTRPLSTAVGAIKASGATEGLPPRCLISTRPTVPSDRRQNQAAAATQPSAHMRQTRANRETGQPVCMTDGKPEPAPVERVTAMGEFMATVLRQLRTGQSSPLEELGLDKAKEELQHWRPDIPGAGPEPGSRSQAPAQ